MSKLDEFKYLFTTLKLHHQLLIGALLKAVLRDDKVECGSIHRVIRGEL